MKNAVLNAVIHFRSCANDLQKRYSISIPLDWLHSKPFRRHYGYLNSLWELITAKSDSNKKLPPRCANTSAGKGDDMSMKNPNLAVCYLRTSTDQQEFSIDSQWRIVSQWAERSGYTIVKRYEDAGISAMESKLEKRVSFLQMIEDSETAGWGTVLVYDSSRFSRSLRDSIV